MALAYVKEAPSFFICEKNIPEQYVTRRANAFWVDRLCTLL